MKTTLKARAIGLGLGAVLTAAGAAAAHAQTIHEVPPIPGGGLTRVYAVNANGTAAAGFSEDASSNDRAIRWTLSGGTQNMGLLPGGVFNSYAQAIDSTGTILAGYGDSGSTRAFRWTTTGGYQLLPIVTGFASFNQAYGMTPSGVIVVGGSGIPSERAFLWNSTSPGSSLNLSVLAGQTSSSARAVSADGSIVVGFSGTRAFSWASLGGMQDLGSLPGMVWARAEAISANSTSTNFGGTVIVGRYNTGGGTELGFRRTVASGMVALPLLSVNTTALRPRAVNGDGTVIIGQAVDPAVGGFGSFVWTPALASKPLAAHLTSRGVNLAGWQLTDATGVSADGTAMCGLGLFNSTPRGWVVRNLPCPSFNSPIGAIGDNGCVGGGVVMGVNWSIQVGATGSVTFRWFRNGVQISDGVQPSGSTFTGATTANLSISNFQVADAGAYTVAISAQGACETLSAPYTLAGPAVIGQNINPGPTTACLGQNPSFFASPSAPSIPPSSVTYRWQKFVGPLPTNWVNINDGPTGNGSTYFGTFTSTFSIFSVQGADSSTYRCIFGVLGCGASSQVASGAAALTVIDSAPAIIGPFDTGGCPGDNDAFLSVAVNPCVGCTYQWQKFTSCPLINCWNNINNGPTGNGGNYGGTNTPNLTVAGLYPGDFADYRCIVSIPCIGNIPSSSASILQSPAPVVISGPTPTSACAVANGSLAIIATPAGSTYQWQKFTPCPFINCWGNINNGPTGNGGTFTGAQSPSLGITGLTIADTFTSYRCIVTEPCGVLQVESGSGTFALASNPAIQSQPVGGLICRNGTKSLSVTLAPGNYGTVTYQWWRFVPAFPIFAGVPSGTLPSGAITSGTQSPSMTISNFKAQDAGQYYCQVLGSCGNTLSAVVNLTLCAADFNCSGGPPNVQDIFSFLSAWFASDPLADIDGQNGINVQDIFSFLSLWFAGC